MNRISIYLVVLMLSLALASGCGKKSDATGPKVDIKGKWEGTLDLSGGHTTRVVLNIGWDGSQLIATMQTPDESPKEVPADSVEFKNDTLTVMVSQRQSTIEAKITGAELIGHFKQTPYDLPLTLKKTGST